MNAYAFRHSLAHRILALLALSCPLVGGAAGCPSFSSCSDDREEPTLKVACFDWPPAEEGAEPPPCPSPSEAEQKFLDIEPGGVDVKSEGTLKNGQCCYDMLTYPYCEGRPYLVDESARTAPSVLAKDRGGWGSGEQSAREVAHLPAELRAILAAEWTRDALFEHASVASFGRFALELLAVGAPSDLIEEAHRAALDEVRHARLCFALAHGYGGETIAPGAFPFNGRVEVESDLATIAARAAKEGCIGETIAASIAAEQLANAQDPAVQAALAIIAADEARHAELAWRTVAWAIVTGGARVRDAMKEVFAGLACETEGPPLDNSGADDERLSAHGRLGAAALDQAAQRAIHDVVRPAARVLLDGMHSGHCSPSARSS